VFEKCIHDRLIKHFNTVMPEFQFAYQTGKSTEINLAVTNTIISDALNNKQQVDVLYIDHSKAFNRPNLINLLKKLQNYGVNGNLLKLLKSYLTDRTEVVLYKGKLSQTYSINAGVPQGSVLGADLFIIYVIDIANKINCIMLGYADDYKMLKVIKSNEDQEDLQRDLDELCIWSRNNADLV